METTVLMFVPEPNTEMMTLKHVYHVPRNVNAVLEPNQTNVPVVPLDGSYIITNVSNHAQTTIMKTTENVNHATIGVKLVMDPIMETPAHVNHLTILIPMEKLVLKFAQILIMVMMKIMNVKLVMPIVRLVPDQTLMTVSLVNVQKH